MSPSPRLEQLKRELHATAPNAVNGNSSDRSKSLASPPQEGSPLRDGSPQQGRERGRTASDPRQIPMPGWKDIFVRSWQEVSANNIFLVAGGVTYAVLLALFPALAALVSIYGLLLDPTQVEHQVAALSNLLPPETTQMIGQELHSLVTASQGSLTIGAGVALLFALWSASRGMSGLITAFNIAYQQQETRRFFKFNLIAIGLTLGMLIGGTVIIALVGVLPAAIQFLGLGAITKWLLLVLEWPLLIAVVMAGLAVLYRYAPNRMQPRWRWVTPGAIAATLLWVLGSIGFTVYVTHFNSYDKTYGALGGVVIMLTWLYLSSFVALFGAVINAQSERQTRADSTVGRPKPMGDRRAYAADTVGESTS
jgi:membrane protein